MLSSFVVQESRTAHIMWQSCFAIFTKKKNTIILPACLRSKSMFVHLRYACTFCLSFVFLFNLFFPRWWDRNPKYYACHVLSRYRQIWHKHLPQSQCNRSSLLQTQLRSFLSLYFCLNFLTQAQALACCEITINARARVAIQKARFLFVE